MITTEHGFNLKSGFTKILCTPKLSSFIKQNKNMWIFDKKAKLPYGGSVMGLPCLVLHI